MKGSYNIGGSNFPEVFKFLAAAGGLGFAWFALLAPVEDPAKSNLCLLISFASIAAYFYCKYTNEKHNTEEMSDQERINRIHEDIDRRFDDVWRHFNEVEREIDECKNSPSCKKSGSNNSL